MPYAGNNPTRQTALKFSEADKIFRLLAGCRKTPAERDQGHPMCRDQSKIPSCRLWVLLLQWALAAGLCLF